MNQLTLKIPVVGNVVPLGWRGVWKALCCVFKKSGNTEVELSFWSSIKRVNITDFQLMEKNK